MLHTLVVFAKALGKNALGVRLRYKNKDRLDYIAVAPSF